MVKNLPASVGDSGSFLGLGRSPEEGNDNPLQYSCLENPRDRGAWWAAVCGVTQSHTRLKQLSSSSSMKVRGFSGGLAVKNLPANAGEVSLISGSERSPEEGNDNPLQFSCLENPMDRGA